MIIALSRFRIVNGLEDAVRQAFVDRPHLVEAAAGFLGMETFHDTADPAVFYLITRWTDAESFRTWHRSEAHHLSHLGIPRGIKLDPAFTRLLILGRVEPAETTGASVVTDAGLVLADFLTRTHVVCYLVAEASGRIRACNAALASRLRVELEALVGQPIWDFLGPNDAEIVRRQLQQGPAARSESVLLHFRDADGRPFTARCQIDPRPDGFVLLGEPAHERELAFQEQLSAINNEWAVIARERAKAVRQLRQAHAEAEVANRSKDLLLSMVSHDLRSPLSAMLHGLAALRRVAARGGDVNDLLDLVERSARFQQRLVDDLLEMGRVASGTLELRQAPVDLAAVAQAAIEDAKHLAEQKRIRLLLRSGGPGPEVWGDRDRLQQVVNNLLGNALKFTGEEGEVTVGIGTVGDEAQLMVSDTGAGMPADLLPTVFDPFRRGRAASMPSGLGLGLWIAKQIVTLHGGTIVAQSAGVGHGSTFVVLLPVLATQQRTA